MKIFSTPPMETETEKSSCANCFFNNYIGYDMDKSGMLLRSDYKCINSLSRYFNNITCTLRYAASGKTIDSRKDVSCDVWSENKKPASLNQLLDKHFPGK